MTLETARPWYKERWPWYLMAGPTLVIIAGSVTAWLAISTSDGLVTEDYYKQGLAVHETLARSQLAETFGLEIRAKFDSDGVAVKLRALAPKARFEQPKAISLVLSHPTRAGLDQQVTLLPQGDTYIGKIRVPASGHWLLLVEDDVKTWRLMGNVVLPSPGEVVIGGLEGPK